MPSDPVVRLHPEDCAGEACAARLAGPRPAYGLGEARALADQVAADLATCGFLVRRGVPGRDAPPLGGAYVAEWVAPAHPRWAPHLVPAACAVVWLVIPSLGDTDEDDQRPEADPRPGGDPQR